MPLLLVWQSVTGVPLSEQGAFGLSYSNVLSGSHASPDSSSSNSMAIGIGVGVAAAAILALVVAYFTCCKTQPSKGVAAAESDRQLTREEATAQATITEQTKEEVIEEGGIVTAEAVELVPTAPTDVAPVVDEVSPSVVTEVLVEDAAFAKVAVL
jgi:hypothetical protein